MLCRIGFAVEEARLILSCSFPLQPSVLLLKLTSAPSPEFSASFPRCQLPFHPLLPEALLACAHLTLFVPFLASLWLWVTRSSEAMAEGPTAPGSLARA